MHSNRWFAALLILLLPSYAIFAQASYDPNDGLYRYLEIWEGRGLLPVLPQLRPYSAEMLRGFLKTVAQKGTSDDIRLATEYLKEVEGVSWHPEVTHSSSWLDTTSYYGATGFGASGFAELLPNVSIGGRIAIELLDGDQSDTVPVGEGTTIDTSEDGGTFAIPFFGRSYEYTQATASSISVGTESISLQAGLTRASFGPFFENGTVIGPQSPATANILFNWQLEKFHLYMGLFCLSERLSGYTPSEEGQLKGGKYLALHGIEALPFPWLTIDVFESIVWYGRFDPMYLIPAAEMFYLQSLNGFADNSWLGGSATARIMDGLTAKGVLYVDDGLQFSAQGGLVWTPQSSVYRKLSIDYTMVLPYTYTHVVTTSTGAVVMTSDLDGTDEYYYTEYTNRGVNIGPALEPNSDRIEARAFITPTSFLDLEAVARLIRHGNSGSDGDGSIYDPGYVSDVPEFKTAFWKLTSWEDLMFLTQSVLDISTQAGLSATLRLHPSWGSIGIWGRYLFEYRINKDLSEGNNGIHNYFGFGIKYAY